MSTNEELQPTILAAQKAVVQNKQTVSIRKVTVQSIAPVIAKSILSYPRVEEHIAFLIEETSNLRKQNANLISAQANQKALQGQIITINTTLQKLSSNINAFNRDKETKLLSHSDQLSEVNQRILKLQRELVFQQQRISQIVRHLITQNNKNESYIEQIALNKSQQFDAIESLKNNLDHYYQQQLYKISTITDQVQDLKSALTFLENKRSEDQQQIKTITNVMTLYENQREQIKKVIEKTTFLEHNAVMIEEYQAYKKFNRIQMELTKKDVKGMIDQALTPEIRKFLPVLIRKLDQLNSFSMKLAELYRGLEGMKTEHSSVISEMRGEWEKKFVYFNTLNLQSSREIKSIINDEVSKLMATLQSNEGSTSQKLKALQQEVVFNKKIAQINFNESITKLQEDNKKYVQSWGEKFIVEKKKEIYLIVEEMKPKEEVNKQNQVFELVYSMEPLIKETKQQMTHSKAELEKAKSEIAQKLLIFSNQIVKFKTDVTRDTVESKRILQNFNKKLKTNDQFNSELSQLVSKVIESTLILYGVSLDQTYLQLDKEVYVCFRDGIVVQIQEDRQMVKYRRKLMNAELLKRAVLKQYTKLIDEIILNQPLLGWEAKEFKPSHFFSQILVSYQALQDQNSQKQDLPSRHPETAQKMPIQPGHQTQYAMPSIPSKLRQPSNQAAMSKTIDFQRQYQTVVLNTPRYSKEKEAKSNRRSVRLKKMERKE